VRIPQAVRLISYDNFEEKGAEVCAVREVECRELFCGKGLLRDLAEKVIGSQ
jgi:hypothetical protein